MGKFKADLTTIDTSGYLLDSEEIQWVQQIYPHNRYHEFRLALAVTLKFFFLLSLLSFCSPPTSCFLNQYIGKATGLS